MALEFDVYGLVTSGTIPDPHGEPHTPTAMSAIHRVLCERFPIVGIGHNTSNIDFDALYHLSRLAMRHALTVQNSRNVTFVEVGTWCGESAALIAAAAIDAAEAILGANERVLFRLAVVDTFEGTLTDLNRVTNRHYGGDIEGLCKDNLYQFEHQQISSKIKISIEICRGESVKIARSKAHIHTPYYVDMVYVDADHTFEGCRDDIQAWDLRLIPGGFMAGHDYTEQFPGVISAVDQCCQTLYGCVPAVVPGSMVWFAKKPLEISLPSRTQ